MEEQKKQVNKDINYPLPLHNLIYINGKFTGKFVYEYDWTNLKRIDRAQKQLRH